VQAIRHLTAQGDCWGGVSVRASSLLSVLVVVFRRTFADRASEFPAIGNNGGIQHHFGNCFRTSVSRELA
jgi:hypothetical protein